MQIRKYIYITQNDKILTFKKHSKKTSLNSPERDKTLLYIGSEVLKSQHAGYTDDEIYVPLIIIDKTN